MNLDTIKDSIMAAEITAKFEGMETERIFNIFTMAQTIFFLGLAEHSEKFKARGIDPIEKGMDLISKGVVGGFKEGTSLLDLKRKLEESNESSDKKPSSEIKDAIEQLAELLKKM